MLRDKPVVDLKAFNRMSRERQRSVTPDINGEGGWFEDVAKAAGFVAEDFHQNPDFYLGANLWRTGRFVSRTLELDIAFETMGLSDGTQIASVNISSWNARRRDQYVPALEDDEVSLYLNIWKPCDGEPYIQAFKAPMAAGLNIDMTPVEAAKRIRYAIDGARPSDFEADAKPRP